MFLVSNESDEISVKSLLLFTLCLEIADNDLCDAFHLAARLAANVEDLRFDTWRS